MDTLTAPVTPYQPEPIWCDAERVGCQGHAVAEVCWAEVVGYEVVGRSTPFCANAACRTETYFYVDRFGEVVEELPIEQPERGH